MKFACFYAVGNGKPTRYPKKSTRFPEKSTLFPKKSTRFPNHMIMFTEISMFLCCRQWKAYPVSQKVYPVSRKDYPISPGCLFKKLGRLFGKQG